MASGVPVVWPNVSGSHCCFLSMQMAASGDGRLTCPALWGVPCLSVLPDTCWARHASCDIHQTLPQIPSMELLLRGLEHAINRFNCLLDLTKKTGGCACRHMHCWLGLHAASTGSQQAGVNTRQTSLFLLPSIQAWWTNLISPRSWTTCMTDGSQTCTVVSGG